jgi:hypothetical protein
MSSTHQLTALRVQAPNRDAEAMQQTVQYRLPQDRTVQWGWFPVELAIWVLPWLCAAALIANGSSSVRLLRFTLLCRSNGVLRC